MSNNQFVSGDQFGQTEAAPSPFAEVIPPQGNPDVPASAPAAQAAPAVPPVTVPPTAAAPAAPAAQPTTEAEVPLELKPGFNLLKPLSEIDALDVAEIFTAGEIAAAKVPSSASESTRNMAYGTGSMRALFEVAVLPEKHAEWKAFSRASNFQAVQELGSAYIEELLSDAQL